MARYATEGTTDNVLALFIYQLIMQGVEFRKMEMALDFSEMALSGLSREVRLSNGWAAGAAQEISARLQGPVNRRPAAPAAPKPPVEIPTDDPVGPDPDEDPVDDPPERPEGPIESPRRRGRHPNACDCPKCKVRRRLAKKAARSAKK